LPRPPRGILGGHGPTPFNRRDFPRVPFRHGERLDLLAQLGDLDLQLTTIRHGGQSAP
jgi:hypothetical protein